MKNIALLLGGLVLKTIAAPVIVTGITAQATARGLVHTGIAVNSFGEAAELKGLTLADNGHARVTGATSELKKSRAERKLERMQNAQAKAEAAIAARRERIQSLQAARSFRDFMEESKNQAVAQEASAVMA